MTVITVVIINLSFPKGASLFILLLNQFVRPQSERYIRLFEARGKEVFSINVATSSAVTYPSDAQGRTLSFRIDYSLLEKQQFYILFDQGSNECLFTACLKVHHNAREVAVLGWETSMMILCTVMYMFKQLAIIL